MGSIRWIFGYINKYKIRFYFAFVAVLISSLISMINPYLSGKLVDEVIMKNKLNMLIGNSDKSNNKVYLPDDF